MIAENMKIAPENFRWYAAFHNEGHHPHIHMIAYSTKPNEAYLTEKGIENIKSNLAKVIFRQDLISIYQKQTEHMDKLRAEAREIVEDLVSKINSEIYISASIQHKLLELADRLSKTKSKKVYGYLKSDVKAIVDSIVEELANDSRIKNCMIYGMSKRKTQSVPTRMKCLTGFRLLKTRNLSQSRTL